MIYYELKDQESLVLSSNIADFSNIAMFDGKERENIKIGKYKNIYRIYPHGTVRLIIANDKDLLNSTRLVSDTANAFSYTLAVMRKMKNIQEERYRVFSHNLVTTHAKLQGEVNSVIPDSILVACSQHSEQFEAVKKAISSDLDSASESFLQIIKRLVDLQAQMQGFKILSDDAVVDMSYHNLKRVLLNISYPFFDDFKKIGVNLRLGIDDDIAAENLVCIDYKLFNVAMHHFMNNIVKYVKPYSRVDVNFFPESNSLEFSMRSIKIDKSESKNIFCLGVSGKNVSSLAGDGVGMFMVEKALKLLNAHMEVRSDYSSQEVISGVPYVENKFIIHFRPFAQ